MRTNQFSSVDIATIEYLEALERKLTNLLPLTNCTAGGLRLRRILADDLRPAIAACHAELEQMGPALEEWKRQCQEDEAIYQQEIHLPR